MFSQEGCQGGRPKLDSNRDTHQRYANRSLAGWLKPKIMQI